MADESGGWGGITQYIRLALDKLSLRQMAQDAADASTDVATALMRELQAGGKQEQAVAAYVQKIRATLDTNLQKIRDDLAKGLIDVPKAEQQAERLASAFNRKLKSGIQKLGVGMPDARLEQIAGAFGFDQSSLSFAPKAAEAEAKGKQFAEAFARGVASAKAIGQQGQAKGREFLKGMQDGMRSGAGSVRNFLTDWFTTVKIPEPQRLGQSTLLRLRKEHKGDIEAYNTAVKAQVVANQLAGSSATKLGSILQRLGLNVFQTSTRFQQLAATASGSARVMAGTKWMAFGQNLSSLVGPIGMVTKGLLGIASAYKLLGFGKQAILEAGEQQSSWARLSVTLSDFGIRLSSVQGQIQDTIKGLNELGYTNAQGAEILATLIQITGNYEKSLQAVPVVVDLMVARHMSLETATKNVGRAIIGDIGSLQRHAIFLDKNKDAITQLTQRFGGEALARSETFRGSVEKLNVAWTNFKARVGEALITAGGGTKTMDVLIESIKELRKWVGENEAIFKALGLAIYVAFMAAKVIIEGFNTSLKLTSVLIGTIYASFKALPAMGKWAWATTMENIAEGLQWISKLIDKVFNTDMAKAFDATIRRARALRREAKNSVEEQRAELFGNIQRTLNGEAIDQSGGGPMARDYPLQNAGHIQAREHQRIRDRINMLRKSVLSGHAEMRDPALAAMDTIYADLQKRLEEVKDNYSETLEINKHIVAIEKVKADLAKQQERATGADRRERELQRRIELLGQVARSEHADAAQKATAELNRIYDELTAKAAKMNVISEAYWQVQKHIRDIDEIRLRIIEDRNQAFATELRNLERGVEHDVDREAALTRIDELLVRERAALAASATFAERITAAERIRALEAARNTKFGAMDQRIQQLSSELELADRRQVAERQLMTLREQLNRELTSTNVIEADRVRILQQIKAITDAIGKPLDIRDIRRQMESASTMSGTWRGREQGLEQLRQLQERVNEELQRTNLLEAERNQLLVIQEQVRQRLEKAGEPSLRFGTDVMNMFQRELPNAIEKSANHMTEVMHTAFTYMMRDSRNLKHAFSSIPKGLAVAMTEEIANMAKSQARAHLAWAIGETAKGIGKAATGNLGAAGAHFASAGQHVAAATAWSLLGGGAGALNMSAQRAYQNSTDFTRDPQDRNRGSAADNMGRIGPDIYLTISGVDPNNPIHQDLVGQTSLRYQERYGGRIRMRTA